MEIDDGRFFMEDLIQQGQGRHNLTSIFNWIGVGSVSIEMFQSRLLILD